MNYVFALLAILGGSFFGFHPETEAMMRITSLGIVVIGLVYLLKCSASDLTKRRKAKRSGWDNPDKSPMAKYIDDR